jgi:hypothetical protein
MTLLQERERHRDMDVMQSLQLGMGMEPNRFISIRRNQVRTAARRDATEPASAGVGKDVRWASC